MNRRKVLGLGAKTFAASLLEGKMLIRGAPALPVAVQSPVAEAAAKAPLLQASDGLYNLCSKLGSVERQLRGAGALDAAQANLDATFGDVQSAAQQLADIFRGAPLTNLERTNLANKSVRLAMSFHHDAQPSARSGVDWEKCTSAVRHAISKNDFSALPEAIQQAKAECQQVIDAKTAEASQQASTESPAPQAISSHAIHIHPMLSPRHYRVSDGDAWAVVTVSDRERDAFAKRFLSKRGLSGWIVGEDQRDALREFVQR